METFMDTIFHVPGNENFFKWTNKQTLRDTPFTALDIPFDIYHGTIFETSLDTTLKTLLDTSEDTSLDKPVDTHMD